MRPFVFHIGVAKSGTTFLQAQVFARHAQILNIGRPFSQSREAEWFTDNVSRSEDIHFDSLRAQDWLNGVRDEAERDGKTVVYSDERLCRGHLNTVTMSRLRELVPDARILITIRNQYDAIGSYYASHGRVFKGAPARFAGAHLNFEEWFDHARVSFPDSYPGALLYADLTKICEACCGSSAVSVLTYEDMTKETAIFARQLGDTLGLDPASVLPLLNADVRNRRESTRLLRYQRLRKTLPDSLRLSRLLPGGAKLRDLWMTHLQKGQKFVPDFTPDMCRWIDQTFAPGNISLDHDRGLNLRHHGYPTGDSASTTEHEGAASWTA